MPLLDLKSVAGATGVLVHFTGGEDLSLFEVSQAASEISTAAPNAEVILGATIDPAHTERVQVILVVTGVETATMEALRPDVAVRRPITGKVREAEPAVVEAAEYSQASGAPAGPAPTAEPQRPTPAASGHLAEALFSQAVTEQPFTVAAAGYGTATEYHSAPPAPEPRNPSPAPAPAQNSLDIPAFLRRRRGGLAETEGGR
jgi:hypothetical protein